MTTLTSRWSPGALASVRTRASVAHHEAGHVLAAARLRVKITDVCLGWDADRLLFGSTGIVGLGRRPPATQIAVYLAGPVAGLRYSQIVHSPGTTLTYEDAYATIRGSLDWGWAFRAAGEETQVLAGHVDQAVDLVMDRWPEISAVAEELLRSRTGRLTGETVRKIIRRRREQEALWDDPGDGGR